MSILQIVDLKKDYGEEPNITHALKGIQFEVDKGEFVGIMGASGSGKTTLLNCISTIDTATDGHIYLDGKDILEIREKDIARFRRESLGFIFQDFNLLDNAVKYTPAGGKIAVSVVLWEMYVEVKVTDTGKGISESNQAAIFRRFYREEEVHEQQGVGIGLYLAREIVTVSYTHLRAHET